MKEFIKDFDDAILTADGFDDALVGVVERFGQPDIACYDKEKCIEILAKDMSYEENTWLGGRAINWSHAFAIVDFFDKGLFTVHIIQIINGKT